MTFTHTMCSGRLCYAAFSCSVASICPDYCQDNAARRLSMTPGMTGASSTQKSRKTRPTRAAAVKGASASALERCKRPTPASYSLSNAAAPTFRNHCQFTSSNCRCLQTPWAINIVADTVADPEPDPFADLKPDDPKPDPFADPKPDDAVADPFADTFADTRAHLCTDASPDTTRAALQSAGPVHRL